MKKKTIIIMGNGPGLAKQDFKLISKFDTFGLNAAYRYYLKNNWWPTYHGCFDYVVTESHRESFKEIIEGKNPIKKCFYLRKISDSSKQIHVKLNRTSNHWNNSEKHFYDLADGGNSGVNAAQIACCMGYNKIILVGVTGKYVEEVSGSRKTGKNTLVIDKKTKNPNYWFEGYQDVGDEYNLPRPEKFHIPGWEKFYRKCLNNNVELVNCSIGSIVPNIPKSNLKVEFVKSLKNAK